MPFNAFRRMTARKPHHNDQETAQVPTGRVCETCMMPVIGKPHKHKDASSDAKLLTRMAQALHFGKHKHSNNSSPINTMQSSARTQVATVLPMPAKQPHAPSNAASNDTTSATCATALKHLARKIFRKPQKHSIGESSHDASECEDSEGTLTNLLPTEKVGQKTYTDTALGGAPITSEEEEEFVWGSTRHITDAALVKLTLRHIDPDNELGGVGCWVQRRTAGAFNQVHIIQFVSGDKVVVRVPCFGQKNSWTSDDATALHSQVMTMGYISANTKLPISKVLGYDVTHDNEIEHPYMLMTFLEGSRVCDVWGRTFSSPGIEDKRTKILKSLAYTISELQHLSFDKCGMLYFDSNDDSNPCVGPRYDFYQGSEKTCGHGITKHVTTMIDPFDSSYDHFRTSLQYWRTGRYNGDHPIRRAHEWARYEMLSMMVDCLPTSPYNASDEPETFILAPPDFDWQNILVDEDCNVTGILDWDSVTTMNRFQGWASTPGFLSHDYDREYKWCGEPGYSPYDYDRYRKMYAKYMAEAMNDEGDCKYTAKSHLFDLLLVALNQRTETEGFLEKIINAALPRVNYYDYMDRVGRRGWKAGEKNWLQGRLLEVFSCAPGPDMRFCL